MASERGLDGGADRVSERQFAVIDNPRAGPPPGPETGAAATGRAGLLGSTHKSNTSPAIYKRDQPEKRKVDSSILSLTTILRVSPLTCADGRKRGSPMALSALVVKFSDLRKR